MSPKNPRLSRRTFLASAASVGVAAAAVALPESSQVTETTVDAKPAPKNGGGYHLSEHVKRYYKTTLV